jgi:hypothetical protein
VFLNCNLPVAPTIPTSNLTFGSTRPYLMSPPKPTLDNLRIERSAELESSSRFWVVVEQASSKRKSSLSTLTEEGTAPMVIRARIRRQPSSPGLLPGGLGVKAFNPASPLLVAALLASGPLRATSGSLWVFIPVNRIHMP